MLRPQMKVIIFGATGMVGQGVLRECLLDPEVETVLSIARSPSGQAQGKLREIQHADFTSFAALESQLAGYDACFFCLGVSSAGMKEPDYAHVTYDFTLAAAAPLARLNPGMTFIYVSGEGTDSSEKGRSMWARVKGKTENALLALPFKAAVMFRPGAIQARHGIRSKSRVYRLLYALFGWLIPVVKLLAPNQVTTTEIVGRAMLAVAKRGAPKRILRTPDINTLGAA
jgi:uncharacterized protein YbjT (DUF2867 family)